MALSLEREEHQLRMESMRLDQAKVRIEIEALTTAVRLTESQIRATDQTTAITYYWNERRKGEIATKPKREKDPSDCNCACTGARRIEEEELI